MAAKRKHSASMKSKTSNKDEASSPPAKKPKEQSKPIHNQAQSPFFRLPQEIRDMIYNEIFIFPETVHITWLGGRKHKFRSFLCKLPLKEQLEYDRTQPLPCICTKDHFACTPRASSPSYEVKSVRTPAERRKFRVMALLRSCKRLYSDTIEMLYTKNCFYISNPRTALELPNHMPQSRLSLFRHVAVESPPWGENIAPRIIGRWKEVVDALEMLDGLQTLWITLRPTFGVAWTVEDLMEPVDRAALAVRPQISQTRIFSMAPVNPSKREPCPRHPGPQHPNDEFEVDDDFF